MRFRDLSKTLPRFRDSAKIFRDPHFSRYHSPSLIMAGKAKNMHQATVVQKVDNTIQWINLYPRDSAILLVFLKLIHWIVIFEQLGPEVYFSGGRG